MSRNEPLTSHTLPGKSHPNVKMAGKHKERVIGIDEQTQEPIIQRVVFDEKGFPVFDPYVKLETRITGDLGKMTSDAHKRMATRQLRANINSGKIDRGLFTDAEFLDITKGKDKIGGFTWHHHQDTGRMQLVPEDLHKWIKHVGGNKLWGIQ